MNDVVIVDAIRTPLGRRKGWLREQHPVNLGSHVDPPRYSIAPRLDKCQGRPCDSSAA